MSKSEPRTLPTGMRRWVFLFLMMAWQLVRAQQYPFVQYSIAEGLSSPNVTCFAQDALGFTWIGTANGLNRFDGTHVEVFTSKNGLPNSHITNLCNVGSSIVGATIEGNLFKINGSRFELLAADATDLSEIYELNFHNDTLWIAAMKGVYTWVNNSLERLSYFKNQDSMAMSGIEFDNKGTLLVGTHHYGIFKRLGNANFKRLPMPDIRGVLDFAVLSNSKLFLGGHHFLINPQDSIIRQYNPTNQRDRNWSRVLCPDGKGGIWIGSDETGLYHFNPKTDKLSHFGETQGLVSRTINALFLDEQGVLWLGTQGKGFIRLYATHIKMHADFDDNNIIGIHKLTEGRILASSLTGGLFEHVDDLQTANYKWRSYALDADYDYFRGLGYQMKNANHSAFLDRKKLIPKSGYTVWSMEKSQSEIWMGMNYALYQKEPHKTSLYNRDSTGFPSDVIYSLDFEKDSLWIGMEVGATCLVNNQMVWRHKSPDSVKNSTKIIFRDSKGRVWLGGNKRGLSLKQNDSVVPAIPNSQWRNVHITDILEDDDGRLWVSSNKQSIAILQEGKWFFISEKQGLPSATVMSMAIYQKQLVVGTDQGIYEANIADINPESYRFYQVDHSANFSIPCNRNAAQVDDKGRFWIGTTSGVLQYQPQKDKLLNSTPSPYLRKAQLLYAPTPLDSFVNTKGIIVVPYAHNSLRIKVGSVYYLNQENVEYSYQLIGGPKSWSDANRSSDITFNNLAPGNYSLVLRGRDVGGEWSQSCKLLTFNIETPFWLSKWFIISLFALFVFMVIAAFRLRTRQLKRRNKELEDYAAARTQEVKEQNQVLEEQYREKEALLQEIHHRVKNNLQIIISLLRLQQRRVDDAASHEVLGQSIGRIKTMSLIHQSLYQTDNLARTNFKTYLSELMVHIMSNFEDVSEIEYQLSGDEIELGTETAIPLALIAHEWVNNIYKHAFPNKKGRVKIEVHSQNNEMQITIADNGIGISKAEFMASKKSLGAKIIRTLSSQLNADLDIDRIPEGGTVLTLTLKLKSYI